MRFPTKQRDSLATKVLSDIKEFNTSGEEKGRDLSKQIQRNSLKAGAHLGRRSPGALSQRVWSPEMSKYILGVRNNFCLFDTASTLHRTLKGIYIITLLLRKGGKIFLTSSNRELHGILSKKWPAGKERVKGNALKQRSQKSLSPLLSGNGSEVENNLFTYSEGRWVGGTLSNWQQVSKGIWNFANFKQQFDKFSKENRISLSRYKKSNHAFKGFVGRGLVEKGEKQLRQLDSPFPGSSLPRSRLVQGVGSEVTIAREEYKPLESSSSQKLREENASLRLPFMQRPDLLLTLNSDESGTLLREASRLKVPVMAVSDSYSNLQNTLYTIPGNSESRHLLSLFTGLLLRSRRYTFRRLEP